MIDVLGPVAAAAHGGCMECDPRDDRGDDIYVFVLGRIKIRLCRKHLAMLRTGLARTGEPPTVLADTEREIDRLTDEIHAMSTQIMTRTKQVIELARTYREKWRAMRRA